METEKISLRFVDGAPPYISLLVGDKAYKVTLTKSKTITYLQDLLNCLKKM